MAHSERGGRGVCGERWAEVGVIGVSVALAAGLSGCTELAPGADTLEREVRANLPDASAVDPRWACLDLPDPLSADRVVPTVDLAMAIVDTVTNAVPPGLSARACVTRDVDCTTPQVGPVSPSDDGVMHLTVRQAFEGFVEITSPSTVSTLYFVNRPLMHDTSRSLAIISTLALNGLAVQAGLQLDPTLGHVLVYVFDCMGAAAEDVALSNMAGGVPFVFVDGLPNLGRTVTSADGIGGFVNVARGYALLEGRRVAGDRALGTTNIVVRPGWFSYTDVQPL